MGDTVIIEDEKPKTPDVVIVEVPKVEKKVVTETTTVTERKEE